MYVDTEPILNEYRKHAAPHPMLPTFPISRERGAPHPTLTQHFCDYVFFLKKHSVSVNTSFHFVHNTQTDPSSLVWGFLL